MNRLPLALLLALTATGTISGCSSPDTKPTPQEVAAFKGKDLTPEQKAKGMAAAMPGALKKPGG